MIPDFWNNPLPWGVGRTCDLSDKMSLPGLRYTILQADLFQKLPLPALKKEAAVCASLARSPHGQKLAVTAKSRGTTPAKMEEESASSILQTQGNDFCLPLEWPWQQILPQQSPQMRTQSDTLITALRDPTQRPQGVCPDSRPTGSMNDKRGLFSGTQFI